MCPIAVLAALRSVADSKSVSESPENPCSISLCNFYSICELLRTGRCAKMNCHCLLCPGPQWLPPWPLAGVKLNCYDGYDDSIICCVIGRTRHSGQHLVHFFLFLLSFSLSLPLPRCCPTVHFPMIYRQFIYCLLVREFARFPGLTAPHYRYSLPVLIFSLSLTLRSSELPRSALHHLFLAIANAICQSPLLLGLLRSRLRRQE